MGSLFPGRLGLQCRHYTVIKFPNPRIREVIEDQKEGGEERTEREREKGRKREKRTCHTLRWSERKRRGTAVDKGGLGRLAEP